MEVAVETLADTEVVMYVENLMAVEVVPVKIVENSVFVEVMPVKIVGNSVSVEVESLVFF